MKLQFRQIEGFIQKPSPDVRLILAYGPDDGLMRERAKQMGRSVVADLNDPFNVAILPASLLIDDPSRLFDEAAQMSMMGGRRLIRIEDGRDGLAPLVKDYLKVADANALVIIEAGELGPRSPLRLLVEKATNAAAVPCYVDDARDVAGLARGILSEAGYTIAPDALAWLAAAIQGDRQRVRAELDKLITYMGAQKKIAAEDVQAAIGDAGAQSLDDLVYGTAGGKAVDALRAYNALIEEGLPAITILRSLQMHFRKLHLSRARTDAGMPAEEAMKKLSPPIFFKQEPAFRAQLQRWSLPALEKILDRLTTLEAQCKTTGAPAETLCAQLVLAVGSR